MKLFTDLMAIDIGTHSLKLVAVTADPAVPCGYRCDEALFQPLPAGLVGGDCTHPTIRDPEGFATLVRRLLGRVKHPRDSLILGVPDRWAKLHLLSLKLKPTELESPGYLTWRLKKMLCPPEMGAVVLDHQILATRPCDEGVECWLMAGILQEEMLGRLSRLFADLHLQLMAVDTSTLGVASLWGELAATVGGTAGTESALFCHIGHETTVVKAYNEGILQYERVIEVAGAAFTELLAEAAGLTLEQAAVDKERRSFFPSDRLEVLQWLPDRVLFARIFSNWLRELHVTFKFYQDKFKIQRLPPIWLTGGSSLQAGLPAFLADYFDTPCERFNGLAALQPQAARETEAVALGAMFTPALGLLID